MFIQYSFCFFGFFRFHDPECLSGGHLPLLARRVSRLGRGLCCCGLLLVLLDLSGEFFIGFT